MKPVLYNQSDARNFSNGIIRLEARHGRVIRRELLQRLFFPRESRFSDKRIVLQQRFR
jgi:hypothetical protein